MEQLPVRSDIEFRFLVPCFVISFIGLMFSLKRLLQNKRGGGTGAMMFGTVFGFSTLFLCYSHISYPHFYTTVECQRGWLVCQGGPFFYGQLAMEYVKRHEAKTIVQPTLETGIWRYRGKWYYVKGRESNQERFLDRGYEIFSVIDYYRINPLELIIVVRSSIYGITSILTQTTIPISKVGLEDMEWRSFTPRTEVRNGYLTVKSYHIVPDR